MESEELSLIGIQEIAQLAGVNSSAVANWRARDLGFPAPVADLAAGPVFRRGIILKWLRTRMRGKAKIMATTIAFINLKGGVAKSTTTVATAQILSGVHGKKVLVIDLDPQTNATVMLIGDARWKQLNDFGHTVSQLFKDSLEREPSKFDLEASIQRRVGAVREVRSVSLLPSSLDLIGIQDELIMAPMGRFRARRPIDILHRALRHVLDDFDFILVDCPPSLGLITLNGLRFADGYVIPTVPDVLSTYGIPQIIQRVEDFADEIGSPIEPYGIVATKFQIQQNVHNTQLRVLRRQDVPVFESVIGQCNELSAAAEFRAVGTLRQKWGYREGFPTYSKFVRELLQRVGEAVPA